MVVYLRYRPHLRFAHVQLFAVHLVVMKKFEVSFVFLLLCLSLALSLSSSLKPLFRAARDADKTGLYIILLKQSTSDEEFRDLRRRAVLLSNDKRLYCSVETVEKAFTLKLNVIARDEVYKY